MRLLLYTGKGGVGKTSIAAATAFSLAKAGQRVLILSTDAAHSLGDSFEVSIGNAPVEVVPGLMALEIDAEAESEEAWGGLKAYFKRFLTAKNGEVLEAEELLAFPGFTELAALMRIQDYYEEGAYDVVVVDCAPTGETLSLLKYPEALGDVIEKVLPIKRKALKVLGPTMERTLKLPMPEDDIFDEFEVLNQRLKALRRLLTDHEVTSIRIVTTPESIVIAEAKRNFSFLHLYGYNADAVIVNRLFPGEALSGYFGKWQETQAQALESVMESFAPMAVFTLGLMPLELKGLGILAQAAAELYGSADPMDCFYQGTLYQIRKGSEGPVLWVDIPFMDKDALDLTQQGDEVVLRVKNQHRRILLPDQLKNREITGAIYREGYLQIQFTSRS